MFIFSLFILSHSAFAQLASKNDSTGANAVPKKVQVSVSIGASKDYDHVVFSKDRPLTIGDFKGTQSDRPLAGLTVAAFIAMAEKHHVQDSVLYLDITVTPLFLKSKSYYQLEYRTFSNYDMLAHAQIMFDIVAMKSCDLMTEIKNYHFSPAHFEDELKELQNTYQEQSEEEKGQFFFDTRRGTDKFAEGDWKRKMNKLLKTQTCYQ